MKAINEECWGNAVVELQFLAMLVICVRPKRPHEKEYLAICVRPTWYTRMACRNNMHAYFHLQLNC